MAEFRSSYIQGFHDEIAHSLNNPEHTELLSLFEQGVSLGTSNTDRIHIPVIFVMCSDGASGDTPSFNINNFSHNIDNFALDLLDIFNTCLEELTLNIKFHLSIKGREDGDLLPHPGVVVADLSEAFEIKSIYNLETSQYEQIEDLYEDKGISIHNSHINGGKMEGIKKEIILGNNILSEYSPLNSSDQIRKIIDFNKVLTIFLVNKINTQNYQSPSTGGISDLGAYFTGVHPALADVKNYVSFLPFSSLPSVFTEDNDIETNRTLNNSESKRVLVTMLGSMFGLLNPGTPDKDGLQSINPVAKCDLSNGCVLTGGNGDCIDDVPVVNKNAYYLYTSTSEDLATCTEADDEYNFMNFSYDFSNQTSELFSISEQQISKVRSAFNLTDCILRNMNANFRDFISEQDYVDIYCETFSPRRYKQPSFALTSLNNSIKSVSLDVSNQALVFNKLKDKINFLCNSIIYRQ